MIDLNFIRQHPDKIKKNNQIRGCEVSVEEILELDRERRKKKEELDEMRKERNQFSKGFSHSRAGSISASVSRSRGGAKPVEIAVEMKKMKELKQKIKDQELMIKQIERKRDALLIQLPNLTHKSVPVGKDETGNQVYKKWSPDDPEEGSVKSPDFKIKPHWEIGQSLDLIDEERGAKIAGSRFWYLKRELVYLEFALIYYALDFLFKEGFIPMLPPMLVRERALYGTGFFPADENEIYRLANPELGEVDRGMMSASRRDKTIPTWDDPGQYLIGTAEVPLAAYHADEIVDVKDPLKYCGFSSCFRREAGTYGKDMQGILRGHQFDKMEMFIFCSEKDSWNMHEYLLATAEKFWQSLRIPYQVILMCSGDIGAPNAKKYDIEGWLPGEEKYREVVSASNDTDFQARRLNIKYLDEGGQKQYVHTLNSTLVAIGRALVTIMENYQTKQGTIRIPEVLKPYTFKIEEIKR